MYLKSEEICKAIKQGKDVTEAVAEIEEELKEYYEEQLQSQWKMEGFLVTPCHKFDALYEVSASVKNFWNMLWARLERKAYRQLAILYFVNARAKFLGIPHSESIRILKEIGWTSADIMTAYLFNRHDTSVITLSPDVVAEAAREDMDTAVLLMEKTKKSSDLFTHGCTMFMNFEWIDFMYFFVGYQDRTFLTTQHKSKRLCKHCAEVLEKLKHGAAKPEEVPAWTDVPDFSIFEGIMLNQRHLLGSAAGQRLRKGNDNNGYYVLSYHLVDEEHGYGASLRFNAFYKAPEYFDQEKTAWGVYFYRFEYLMLFDYVPDSWRCRPEDLPEAFVRKAYRAFSKLAGLKVK